MADVPGWICSIDDQGMDIHFRIHVDTLDDSEVSIRSINEPWMEKINTVGPDQYGGYGGGGVVVEEIRPQDGKSGSP